MKSVHVHLEGPHTLAKAMGEDQVEVLRKQVEKGLKSKDRDKKYIAAFDLSNNPFYFRLGALVALDVQDFDIKDL